MRTLLLLLFCITGISAYSQSLCRIYGADVYTATGLDVYIGGSIINDSASNFENQGNIHVVGDFLNNGQFNHQGQFSLSGNWINNAEFIAQPNSDVFLDGANQSIKGIYQTNFGRLQLNGSGEKILEQHTQTESLFLFDRLLLTDSSFEIIGFRKFGSSLSARLLTFVNLLQLRVKRENSNSFKIFSFVSHLWSYTYRYGTGELFVHARKI